MWGPGHLMYAFISQFFHRDFFDLEDFSLFRTWASKLYVDLSSLIFVAETAYSKLAYCTFAMSQLKVLRWVSWGFHSLCPSIVLNISFVFNFEYKRFLLQKRDFKSPCVCRWCVHPLNENDVSEAFVWGIFNPFGLKRCQDESLSRFPFTWC